MSRLLEKGMTGADVKLLQQMLNHHLAPAMARIAEDGKFGTHTFNAVIEFQTRNRYYPCKMPLPPGTPAEFRRPLDIDGVVGPLTSNVLLDVRTVQTVPGANFKPRQSQGADDPATGPTNRFSLTPVSAPSAQAPPASTPSAQAPPASPPSSQTFRLVQLSVGQQATANPWSLSPFVFTGQYSLLAKNDGRPDFLLTGGGQVALNDGKANGRWTGQGFLQMGLGGFPKLFGKLDWANPFVALMLSKNFNPNQPATLGAAIGNQITWTLLSKPLPGADDSQDTLSLFFNFQEVANVNLTNGQCAAPGSQFLIGAIKTFF